MDKLDALTDDIYGSVDNMVDEQYENMLTEKNNIISFCNKVV